jgi:hypothetical protein
MFGTSKRDAGYIGLVRLLRIHIEIKFDFWEIKYVS